MLAAILFDIIHHRLFKPVSIKTDGTDKRSFLKLPLDNKGINAIDLDNILHLKSVKSKISPYFKGSVCTYNFVYLFHTHCNQNF